MDENLHPHEKTDLNGATSPNKETKNERFLYAFIWIFVCAFFGTILMFQVIGYVQKTKKTQESEVAFNIFDGSFQESFENKLLNQPMMATLKEQKNMWEFRLFDKINLEESYIGKNHYVFGESMTRASFGDDFYGDSIIREQVLKARFVQDELRKNGVELLILFAPGKSSIYPEYLPDYVRSVKKKSRNYERYVSECKRYKVNNIDFVQYFKQLKPTSKYPLFPKFGSHWSYYAECIVVDTTIKRLERLMNRNLPNIHYENIQEKDTTLFRDADVFNVIKLEVPKEERLAYPQKIYFDKGKGIKPEKILGIGDSFFRGFFYLGAMQYAFGNSKQWYYYNRIVPEDAKNPEVWELDLKSEILKTKAVVIICNEMNLKNLGNGFIDEAYELFKDPKNYYRSKKNSQALNRCRKEIRMNSVLLNQLSKSSIHRGITLDSIITETALKMLKNKKLN